ncbi:hypothetical protein [Streptomyces sp. NPDC093261]|uniref:hypothetical protein n=1 Tax=Streptomyces sp. NPDC093261 TaxID=3366037 RepID=UPI0038234BE4
MTAVGILWRLFAPKPIKKARRTVRKTVHPVRTARRAVTPKPVKKLGQVAHPVGFAKLKVEDAIVDAVRGNSSKSGTSSKGKASVQPVRGQQRSVPQTSYSAPPPPWQPKPGWGTVRHFTAVKNDHGGTDVAFRFIPDDGSKPFPVTLHDCTIPELGEYARGIWTSDPADLLIMVTPATLADLEETVFPRLNSMEPVNRALLYTETSAQGNDFVEMVGWTWTADYKVVRAAPGLMS